VIGLPETLAGQMGETRRPPADPGRQHRGVGSCRQASEMSLEEIGHIHRQHIYIEVVIVRMASEATPQDPDRVRGWRRGFDAIAEYFFMSTSGKQISDPSDETDHFQTSRQTRTIFPVRSF
jgi:hypothetical protein